MLVCDKPTLYMILRKMMDEKKKKKKKRRKIGAVFLDSFTRPVMI